MNTDTIQDIIRDAHALAQRTGEADLICSGAETIARRLERLVAHGLYSTPKEAFAVALANPPLRIPVVSVPGRAALAYRAHAPEIPPLKADIETGHTASGEVYQECQIYLGKDVLAHMTIWRGKAFAVRMVRAAFKGAMSRLGKHRRMTANRRKREGK